MKNEMRLALKKLKQAVKRLEEVVHHAKSDIVRDAAIQRFEFTFELLWKTLKIFLEAKGVLARTPKDTFREAFRLGLIRDEAAFLKMLDARNIMSHVYDEREARQIYKEVTHRFIKPIQSCLRELEKQHTKDRL